MTTFYYIRINPKTISKGEFEMLRRLYGNLPNQVIFDFVHDVERIEVEELTDEDFWKKYNNAKTD